MRKGVKSAPDYTIIGPEYKKPSGGKKSRKNRKHKTKSATKRRTTRKRAY